MIKRLRLINYRNYEQGEVNFFKGINVLVGENATGKTNLLEAVALLEAGRSFRTNNVKELIRWETGEASVKGEIERQGRLVVAEALLKNNSKKIVVNGCAIGKGRRGLTVALFLPDHLKIIKETPEHRRTFLDGLLEKLRPDYLYWLRKYQKVLRQRNALLRKLNTASRGKDAALGPWDRQLVDSGVKITEARQRAVRRISDTIPATYRDIAGNGKDSLGLEYQSQLLEEGQDNKKAARFIDKLEARRNQELERGITLTGPHRDDLFVTINGREARSFGSQGEQRSAALSLKLTELRLLEEELGEAPVLLLDDVMSELDDDRRRLLMDRVAAAGQAVITTTNTGHLAGVNLKKTRVIEVAGI